MDRTVIGLHAVERGFKSIGVSTLERARFLAFIKRATTACL
jgi:hypothetical protein